MLHRFLRPAFAVASLGFVATTSCLMDRAPTGLRRTPSGPGATVRFDLAAKPLPEIPIPNDTATWPDPTSRTGLRINASLIAPTEIEQGARERFSRMEGWGTFAPISLSFDIDREDEAYRDYDEAAVDLANMKKRHIGDDYDFADDAVYLVNLTTGVPVPLDLGAGNFNYTLKKLDKYWANDTRVTERNLIFESIDETEKGAITKETFLPEHDHDFDGTLDQANLDDQGACPGPDAVCDMYGGPEYGTAACKETRRSRDRCIADHLLTWYERETDTLLLRPVLPLDEMTRYAVVLTDRLVDGRGNPVKSPFNFVYHAAMESTAQRVLDVMNDPKLKEYYGDMAGSGLSRVGFTWSFTTQPTVDDMKRLRDGLYGQGPFKRWAQEFPPKFEPQRAVGLQLGLTSGATDAPGWQTSPEAEAFSCGNKLSNLYIIKYENIRQEMRNLLIDGFDVNRGPGAEVMLKAFDSIDYMMIGTYKSPFLLEGGPKSTDPNAAFDLNFLTGKGEETTDEVQFWLIVPKETEKFKQPFNVNIYGHGYTGNFVEEVLYAGNMAQHGLATIGINAMGHGLSFGNPAEQLAATGVLGGTCLSPFYDALTQGRARDLNNDGIADSGGDFWTSYLFHTRDGVRQSILDHIQLVRIMRAFGTPEGQAMCRNDKTGWDKPASQPCDMNADGKADVAGDFDNDGVADLGGPKATYGTWGESLGGILSGIHGAIDAYVTAAVPGSGGGGLTDIGIRSFQGGVVEAVLLRIWGPLLVTVPASDRPVCTPASEEDDRCTLCIEGEVSVRWVMPDLNGTGELEITCLAADKVVDTTVFVTNNSNGELKCASIGEDGRVRIGLPSSVGDEVQVDFYPGQHQVENYKTCVPTIATGTKASTTISKWGVGRLPKDASNTIATEKCHNASCGVFQGRFFGEGSPLTAPAEGFGLIRQTPSVRRFIQLAQAALEPGDPVSFAPFYSIKKMTDPFGKDIAPHALITANTIGDMNVPLNSGIAFARASGALPFFRPDQLAKYPHFADYTTPEELFQALGNKTPNRVLIDNHVVEGITVLARHPAGPECTSSSNSKDLDGTFPTPDNTFLACFPTGCTEATESKPEAKDRICYYDSHCDFPSGRCVPNFTDLERCEEALFDADDLDEGGLGYYEQNAPVPVRAARYTRAAKATPESLAEVWAPRIGGAPFSADGGWKAERGKPLTALIDAYIVPQGVHTWVNGEPCEGWDSGTYLTNLTARFFMSDGSDIYFLSHPSSHQCMGTDVFTCEYLK